MRSVKEEQSASVSHSNMMRRTGSVPLARRSARPFPPISRIRSEQTAVGDRFVYECMQQNGYSLGGEQSGHIILRKYATTGDGLLTAIMLAEEMRDRKASLSQLAAPVLLYPQTVRSIRVNSSMVGSSERAARAMDRPMWLLSPPLARMICRVKLFKNTWLM